MLIGLCGGRCAGKQTVANHLIDQYGFLRVVRETPGSLAAFQANTAFGGHDVFSPDEPVVRCSDNHHLLDLVTQHWQLRLVTIIEDEALLDAVARRPFFLLISIDAPIILRWKRLKSRYGGPHSTHACRGLREASANTRTPRCEAQQQFCPSLSQFVQQDDHYRYGRGNMMAQVMDRADLRLLNTAQSLAGLHHAISLLDLTNERRFRPDWDQYFMQLASLAAHRSNCMKRRVGCVLVNDRRVISTGYNGTPRGLRNCNEGGCARCNGVTGAGVALSTCLCIHAEENALLEAGRERIRPGTVLYCDTCPCLTCSIKIAQVGISEVVYNQSYSMDQEAAMILAAGGVHLRQFTPASRGLVDLADLSALIDAPDLVGQTSPTSARVPA
ncbi:MAG: Peroxisomal membrane protein PMP27 [Watsoniomyces obsoletus]|nr:MAG: Peroxisomal membrane protein PMP27 [Watsoniomyces obsoletus]